MHQIHSFLFPLTSTTNSVSFNAVCCIDKPHQTNAIRNFHVVGDVDGVVVVVATITFHPDSQMTPLLALILYLMVI